MRAGFNYGILTKRAPTDVGMLLLSARFAIALLAIREREGGRERRKHEMIEVTVRVVAHAPTRARYHALSLNLSRQSYSYIGCERIDK